MDFPRLSRALLLIPFCCAVMTANGQTASSTELQGRTVPSAHDLATNAPFSLSGTESLSVEVRPAETMSQQDKDLEAGAESVIREKAGFEDLGFGEGGWSYSQLVCPAFPNNLLLRFTRDQGKGERSMFSVSIPRQGEGNVRLIPILRKGYSLFSPAPINAMTVSAFNHILKEASNEPKPDFGAVAACYAALTGAPAVADASGRHIVRSDAPPILHLNADGGTDLMFSVGGAHRWLYDLEFNRAGKLAKASRSAEGADEAVRTVPSGKEPQWRPIPAGSEPKAHSIPASAEPTVKPVPVR